MPIVTTLHARFQSSVADSSGEDLTDRAGSGTVRSRGV
jgi:uncharacterized protein YlxP (DUF503 family)